MDRALADRIALDDLLTAYAVAVDSDALERLAELSTGDAVFDYTTSNGPRGGVAEVTEWLAKALAFVPLRQHLIVNRVWTVDTDSGVANVAAYFFNPMSVRIPRAAGPDLWNPGGGHYDVAFRRTARGWRISELVMRETWRVAVPGQASGGH